MSQLQVSFFGRFTICCPDEPLPAFAVGRVPELAAYLLLFRSRPHRREQLAEMLWPDKSPGQAKGYLRKTLWQLHSALDELPEPPPGRLESEGEWVQWEMPASSLDIAQFDAVYHQTRHIPGHALPPEAVQVMNQAIQLYHGELLEGWYQEWCLFERERLARAYIIMLDKLLEHSLAHARYVEGQRYGLQILQQEPAHERTHRRLMRLYHLAGDRCQALRQYELCRQILRRELDVAPGNRTQALWARIRADEAIAPFGGAEMPASVPSDTQLQQTLDSLKTLQHTLAALQSQIQAGIEQAEAALKK